MAASARNNNKRTSTTGVNAKAPRKAWLPGDWMVKTSARLEFPGQKRRRQFGRRVEGHQLPRLRPRQQRAGNCIIERMPGFERNKRPDQRMPQQIEVADGIEHLVLGEFVVVAQSFAVQHAGLIEHDGVLQATAEREPRLPHRFDILHEAEGTGAAYFLGVGVLGEVDDDLPVFRSEHRVREVDREIELEAVIRLEARPLVVLAYFHRLLDAQIALARSLLLDPG